MVEHNSKDLLQLETNSTAAAATSTSVLESKLLFCTKDSPFSLSETPVEKPGMFPVPKSHVLGKVKDFLSVISESNKKLMDDAKKNPDNYDIEVLSGRESEFIEMDLMLGVADLHTPEAVAAAESAMAGNPAVISLAESSSESEFEDSSDDEDNYDEDGSQSMKIKSEEIERDSSCNAFKKQNSKKRPRIEELS